jgi:hypothetical protein
MKKIEVRHLLSNQNKLELRFWNEKLTIAGPRASEELAPNPWMILEASREPYVSAFAFQIPFLGQRQLHQ